MADENAQLSRASQITRQGGHGLLVAYSSKRAIEQSPQNRRLQRLFNIPISACVYCLDHALVAATPGYDDHRNSLDFLAEMSQQIQAIHTRKLDVSKNDAGLKILGLGQGFFAAGDSPHLKAP